MHSIKQFALFESSWYILCKWKICVWVYHYVGEKVWLYPNM